MCSLPSPCPTSCWPALPWLFCVLCSATAMASMSRTAATLWKCSAPSSPLMRLHVQTLKLKPSAGKRPPYTMRAPRLRLVKPA